MNTNEKLREALEELIANIEMRSSSFGLNVMVDTKAFLDAKAALALPRRNCDVGTAEEQSRRFMKYCDNFGRRSNGEPKCHDCPLLRRAIKEGGNCEFMWGQMPYEEVKHET